MPEGRLRLWSSSPRARGSGSPDGRDEPERERESLARSVGRRDRRTWSQRGRPVDSCASRVDTCRPGVDSCASRVDSSASGVATCRPGADRDASCQPIWGHEYSADGRLSPGSTPPPHLHPRAPGFMRAAGHLRWEARKQAPARLEVPPVKLGIICDVGRPPEVRSRGKRGVPPGPSAPSNRFQSQTW